MYHISRVIIFLWTALQCSLTAAFLISTSQHNLLLVGPVPSHTPSQCRIPSSLKESLSLEDTIQAADERKYKLAAEFVTQVETSIQEERFVSLTLRGAKTNKSKNNADAAGVLRGSIRQVQGRLIKVNNKKTDLLLQLTLKYHGATDICKNLRLDELSERLHKLILDPTLASEWGIEAVQANPMQGAELKTLDIVWDLQLQSSKPKLSKKKATTKRQHQTASPEAHDREKNVPLSKKADFWQSLGLTKPDGTPRPGMKSKLRQCQKFVEIVGGVIQKSNSKKPISIVDMGCGRGYLTFSLHSYLADNYDMVSSRGIDVRPKLVEEISGIARSLGGNFDTLTFEEGTIEDFVNGASTKDEGDDSLDILIALHACDTATDDALWTGICSGADLIVVAPCCHKQIRPQLNAHYAADSQNQPLSDLLRHGVYRERLSEMLTDSLRALLLEAAGYKVQVFEFIGGEHTSKNVMITAVKRQSKSDNTDTIGRIQSLAKSHGIRDQKLAEWMNIDLGGAPVKSRKRLGNQMPPLAG